MRRGVCKIVALATYLGAFLLLPSTSQAGSSVEFGVISMGGGVNGLVCESKMVCQFPDPIFGDALQPAIAFDLDNDQDLYLESDIYDGSSCDPKAYLGTAFGTLPLPAGHDIIFLRFSPPLDEGSVISLVWRVGDCPEKDCVDYTIGSDPGICE